MAITGMQGHQINPQKVRYAISAEAITLPEANVALGVVYDATAYGSVRLPDSDGEIPAGVVYGKSATGAGEEITMATGELAWMVAAEAITIGQLLMLDDATGYCLVATSAKPLIGRALTAQSNVGGFLLVELMIGCYGPA
jgi:hypothetical protein